MGRGRIRESCFRIENPFAGHLNVWPFKTAHYKRNGSFNSFQKIPSSATLRYTISGRWAVAMKGQTHVFGSGRIFCTMPSEVVEFRQLDENAGWEWLELQFSGPEAESFLLEFGLSPESPVVEPEKPAKALRLFKRLHSMMEDGESSSASIAAAVFELIDAVGAKKAQPAASRPETRAGLVRMAKLLLESSLHFEDSVEKLSARLGVERTTLYRAFREEAGMSPHEYIGKLRLIRAEEMLSRTSLPVSAIAAQTGFKDAKYFISWFKTRKALPPAAWRRKQRKETAVSPSVRR